MHRTYRTLQIPIYTSQYLCMRSGREAWFPSEYTSFPNPVFEILHTSLYSVASWRSGNVQASYSGVTCSNLGRYIGYIDTPFGAYPGPFR
jgi:hypothetical protein